MKQKLLQRLENKGFCAIAKILNEFRKLLPKMKLKPLQRPENKGYYAATGLASQRQKILKKIMLNRKNLYFRKLF